MSIQIRSLNSFNKVRFHGPGTLTIHQGDSQRLTISAPGYIIEQIESEVASDCLNLGYVNHGVVSLLAHRETISYHLEVKDLKRLSTSGSGKVEVPDLDCDQLELNLSGSGSLSFHKLTTDALTTTLSGSGKVMLAGDVETQSLKISGSGSYLAGELVSDSAEIKVIGSGNGTVMVHDELKVHISGSGDLSYLGRPEVIKTLVGSGRVIRMRPDRETDRGRGHGY